MKKSDGLSYVKRHKKFYRAPKVNAIRTPERRREIYKQLRESGMSANIARQFRDFDEGSLSFFGVV